jgi:DNA-directed RNA polymerase specialized sigma24 family protein
VIGVSDDPFVTHRGLLFTVAYELLGSAADAEDVVQETWLRWAGIGDAARDGVRDPRAYLVRMVTRQALNRLRTLARRREDYVGPWLPEPVVGRERAVALLARFAQVAPGVDVAPLLLNGAVAARIDPAGEFDTVVSFVVEGGRIAHIYAIRNPHKLERLHEVAELRR